jgi:hypothetical protein
MLEILKYREGAIRMDYRFTDPNETMRAVLRNNIESSEREYAALTVAVTMQSALATDVTNSDNARASYAAQASATQERLDQIEKQLIEYNAQYDAIPEPTS